MIPPPNFAEQYPQDYLDYIAGRDTDETFKHGVLFSEPKDPGVAMGRQGNENFWYSALLGFYHEDPNGDWMQIILKYDAKTAYGPKEWQYGIARGAEWSIVLDFTDMAELVWFMKNS